MSHNFQVLTRMDVVRRINVTALIEEVKKHPILYNNTPKQTHTTETKKKTWESIAENLCGADQWQLYDFVEKETVGREIQLKWKNLKDNFHRILRKEKEDEINGVSPHKKRKYIYYDALEFLKPFAPSTRNNDSKEEPEMEGGKNATNIIYINETVDSEEDSQMASPTIAKQAKVQTPLVPPITPLQPMPSFGTLQPVQFIQLQPNTGINPKKEELDEATATKLAQVLDQLVKSQEEEKNDDPMGNKKFLMSLLPFLRKMPDDVNLEVRLQIMGVIQSYRTKDMF